MATFPNAETLPVRARILTDEYDIEGNVHLKKGPYRGRVSDILNAPEIDFIPVTDAKCTRRGNGSAETVEADCTIVQVSTIKMVFPFED